MKELNIIILYVCSENDQSIDYLSDFARQTPHSYLIRIDPQDFLDSNKIENVLKFVQGSYGLYCQYE